MSNKRKDNRGRVLRTGESQRKDGTYDYRYTDTKNNRCSVYASALDELRQKETEIQRMKSDGISYAAADITVLELLERYINMKQRAVRYTTRSGYQFVQSGKNAAPCSPGTWRIPGTPEILHRPTTTLWKDAQRFWRNYAESGASGAAAQRAAPVHLPFF